MAATETALNTVTNTTTAISSGIKAFVLAHPVGIAIVGGAVVGAGTYWLMNKYLKKNEEPAPAAA
ncbi:MAG: hypothetical protein KAI83_17930 [Thiomargarita sp.]|nr:hypothetical protein [Thiomargarita sp.]